MIIQQPEKPREAVIVFGKDGKRLRVARVVIQQDGMSYSEQLLGYLTEGTDGFAVQNLMGEIVEVYVTMDQCVAKLVGEEVSFRRVYSSFGALVDFIRNGHERFYHSCDGSPWCIYHTCVMFNMHIREKRKRRHEHEEQREADRELCRLVAQGQPPKGKNPEM